MFKSGEVLGPIVRHLPNQMVEVNYGGTILTLPKSDNELTMASGGPLSLIDQIEIDVSGYERMAPNGKPSKLSSESYYVVRQTEFLRFFGNWLKAYETGDYTGVSKVIDENGEPLLVYHGTTEEFNVFEKSKIGSGVNAELSHLGFYFTEDAELAEDFTREDWTDHDSDLKTGSRVISVFLNIKKPRALSVEQFIENSSTAPELLKEYKDALIRKGFDGIIVEKAKTHWQKNMREFDGRQYIVFDSAQVKLAEGLNLDFNPNNPDIRYEDGGPFDLENSGKQGNFEGNLKNEIRNILSGKSQDGQENPIEAAAAYLRANARIGSEGTAIRKSERQKLEEYISQNNLWFNGKLGVYLAEGVEQRVYRFDANNVVKLNPSTYYSTWLSYLNNLLLHNFFFPDTAYELIGFMRYKDELNAVVTQPFIDAEPAKIEDIRKFMSDNGFINTGHIYKSKNDYQNDDLGIRINDLHEKNVLAKEGTLYFIDTSIKIANKAKFERGGKINPGDKLPGTTTFYRVPSGFENSRETTAKDVIDFEDKEYGNTGEANGARRIAAENNIDLSKVPARDVIWVTRTKTAARRYGSDIWDEPIENALILVDDGDNGYLVLKNSDKYIGAQLSTDHKPIKMEDGGKIFAGAGVLIFASNTGRCLFLLRSEFCNHPETWAFPGGKIEEGENPLDAAKREVEEETGYKITTPLQFLFKSSNHFLNYVTVVQDEFQPELCSEHDHYIWTKIDKAPAPLHFGVKELLSKVDLSKNDKTIKLSDGGEIGKDLKLKTADGKKYELPPNHEPFIAVPKGGANCGNCLFFFNIDKPRCINHYFTAYHGTSELPQNFESLVSDWYTPALLERFSLADSVKMEKKGSYELPKDHNPFMKVRKGGSSCATCKFLSGDKKQCINPYFKEYYGQSELPKELDQYCSDWYEPIDKYVAGGEVTVDRDGKSIKYSNSGAEADIQIISDNEWYLSLITSFIGGMGYSYELMKRMIRDAKEAGAKKISLIASPMNAEYFKPYGFKDINYDEEGGFYRMELSLTAPRDKTYKTGGQIKVYTEAEIKTRWKKKKNHLFHLAEVIQSLRNNVTRSLRSENEHERLTALAVALIDETCERVGNEGSASEGHLGVTGFKKGNVKFEGAKVFCHYVGKSGVKHEKSFTNYTISKALKTAIANSPTSFIFTASDGFKVKCDTVNKFLEPFGITAHNIRGFHANKFVVDKLESQKPEKEEKDRKKQFNEAVKFAAEKVGHTPATLKKHYLLPKTEEKYIKTGTIQTI